ncbi:low molecular weight phosphatase family protein [Maribacter antarcticus]|uniref:protein-tyrosine-phosphatase n=1 Tax=Maribacter antarcticus TaxID=505250 RepID=UPI00047E7AC6|nr:protein-tyrosine-phosphatase [Maribacter antarcticus]
MQIQNSGLFQRIQKVIGKLDILEIPKERILVLQSLIDFIQDKKDAHVNINLNFICTHNSRRSHLTQIWAQTMAAYFKIENVFCYSGGTEATALFPKVIDVLSTIGFEITNLTEGNNPVYSIKLSDDLHPIISFSKTYDNPFNPKANFAAIMTCGHADENCPFIPGAEKRIPLTFEDPKAFDNTPLQTEKYLERSVQIATELSYVFSKIQ